MKSEQFLTTADLSLLMGRTEGAIRALVYRGVIPSKRFGRTIYFVPDEIESIIKNLKPYKKHR